MIHNDFEIVSKAVLLYFNCQNSLFADQVVSNTLHTSSELIKEKFFKWFRKEPHEIVAILQPARIRNQIEKTINWISTHPGFTGRVLVEPMKADEVEDDCKSLIISYQFAETIFGRVIIASANRGVCYLAFTGEDDDMTLTTMKKNFPKATFARSSSSFQNDALSFFEHPDDNNIDVVLQVKATAFQIKVWKKLLTIPYGGLISYSGLAGNRRDSHAFGNAVGSNPVAYIIPCHRTVRASGEFGEYHWGTGRKAALICLEALHETI